MSVQTMTIKEFMNYRRDDTSTIDKIVEHLNRHKITYRIIGTTLFIFFAGLDATCFASTGIDVGGRKIYAKLLGLAKWVIIIKGGWDTINNTVKGDFDYAKKSFFSYLLVYVILLGLPWALDEVDTMFKGM